MYFNPAYRPLFDSKARYKHLYGGRGAGRSYTIAQYFIIRIMSSGYFRGIIAREHFNDIRSSQWQQLKDIIEAEGISDQFKFRDNTMHLTHTGTGNTIFAKGFRTSTGSAKAKMKSITEATAVWIEEAEEVGKEEFTQLDASLRSTKTSNLEILLTYNPEDESHWIKPTFHDSPREDTLVIHTTYKDNLANLSDSYVALLERLEKDSPDYAKVYVHGLWGGGVKGRIYEFEAGSWPENEKSVYGLDFGFTNDPTALVEVCVHNGRVHVRQLIYETGLTNQDIAQRMATLGVKKTATIYADSSEPKSIEEIYRMGYNIHAAVKGPDSVNAGIQRVKQYGPMVICDSPDVMREARQYQWAKDKEGNPVNKPVDAFNHAMDAARYGTVGLVGKPKAKVWATLA